jgi:glycosyltransferase involved in cell wall biosynthesis
MKNKKIIFITRYNKLGASSRQRFLIYFGLFSSYKHIYFFDDEQLLWRYGKGRYSFAGLIFSYVKFISLIPYYSLCGYQIVVEKEIFPYLPYWVERCLLLCKRVIYDYDDAVHLNYDLSNNMLVKFFLKGKINKLMKTSFGVIVGNRNLYDYASNAGATNVVYIPTVVDDCKFNYISKTKNNNDYKANTTINIIWIGSPTTAKYLNDIIPILSNLAHSYEFVLTIVGATNKHFKSPPRHLIINYIEWSQQSEMDNLLMADIGIMPLIDDAWERGKCGYKLIQYMSCSIPAIASPVGINSEILQSGTVGFLCSSEIDWRNAFITLFESEKLRKDMGFAGYKRFIDNYSLTKNQSKFFNFVTQTP